MPVCGVWFTHTGLIELVHVCVHLSCLSLIEVIEAGAMPCLTYSSCLIVLVVFSSCSVWFMARCSYNNCVVAWVWSVIGMLDLWGWCGKAFPIRNKNILKKTKVVGWKYLKISLKIPFPSFFYYSPSSYATSVSFLPYFSLHIFIVFILQTDRRTYNQMLRRAENNNRKNLDIEAGTQGAQAGRQTDK